MMDHIQDRESVHAILDAVLDTIERLGEDNYATFDVSSCSIGVRVSIPVDREGWDYYWSLCGNDPVGPEQVKEIKDALSTVGQDDARKMDKCN